jgi:site-specific recombinase XerD
MEIPFDSVWERCRFTEFQAAEVPNFRNWLRESEIDLGVVLADATISSAGAKYEFEVADVRELESLIANRCSPKTEVLFYGGILKIVIRELNRTGALIPSPKLLDSLRREKHPCPDEYVQYHLQVKDWSEAACRWIRRCKGEVPVGLVALCSILWGRALHPDTVLAIADACSDSGKRFRFSSGRIYADLSLPWNNLQHQEIQRWYADGPLACLIARSAHYDGEDAPPDSKETKAYSAWKKRVIDALFDEIRRGLQENQAKETPRDLAAIMRAVNLTLISYVPQLFRTFWTREIHPRSLWPSSIGRIYGEESLASEIILKSGQILSDDLELDEEILKEAEEDESRETEKEEDALEWLDELLECLKDDPKESARLLRAQLDSLREASPIAGELAEFALRLIEKGSLTTGTRWKPRTIRRCVRTVAVRLGQLVGDANLAESDAGGPDNWYRLAIELVTEGKDPNRLKDAVMMAIREFHRFLVNKNPNLAFNESEVFRSYRGLFSVDARILSIEDILQVFESITKKTANKVHQKAAKFLIVMAFSIGSRRMENFWLRDIDFPASMTFPVIIRPWGTHRLKTLNAARVAHFTAFHMPPEFEQVVVDWYQLFDRTGKKNPEEGTAEDRFLMRESEGANRSIPVHVLIPIIHEAMQEVTGDPTVHLHSLRHSCASWTFIRLLLSDFKEIPDLFPHLKETNEWIKKTSKPFRAALYLNENITNDHGWAISTELGQSRPDVAVDNYIHTFDRLSPLVLSESGYLTDVCDGTLLRDASGLEGTYYNRLKSHETKKGKNIDARSLAEIIEEVVTLRIPRASPVTSHTPRQNWVNSTYELMRLSVASGQPAYDLAPEVGIVQKVAEGVLLRAGESYGIDKDRLGRLPKRPPKKDDAAISELAAMVEQEIEREEQRKTKQQMSGLLKAYRKVKRPIPEFAVFKPTTSLSAIEYMDCLAVVGIRREDLRFVLWEIEKGSDGDKALQKIGGRHPYEYRAGQLSRVLSEPCLTIGPRFDPGSPKAALRSESALRFVLEMAWLRFGVSE